MTKLNLRAKFLEIKGATLSALLFARKLSKTPWSIRTDVRREMQNWLYENPVRRAYRYGLFSRILLVTGEHPVGFACALLTISSAIALWLCTVASPLEFAALTKWDESVKLGFFTTLWSVQATLAALVYPIVIAFVAVFLQRRPAAETFIHLYMLDSGGLVAGLSSLVLVVAMAFQYLLVPFAGVSPLLVLGTIDSVWFLVNAVLTAFFLYRTIEFLRPDVQLGVVCRYVVSVALPRNVAQLYSFQLTTQLQKKGWVSAVDYLDEGAREGPRVLLARFSFNDGEPQRIRDFKVASRLINVRLWALRLVVDRWSAIADRSSPPPPADFTGRRKWPLLVVPMIPGGEYSGQQVLAEVSNGPDLTSWQKRFLHWSLVFKPIARERHQIGVRQILDELVADALDAASIPDVPRFERAYSAFLEVHRLLLGASRVTWDDGTQGSWAQMPERHGFQQPMHENWAHFYRSLFEAAVRSMSVDSRPIRRLSYLVRHLSGTELDTSPVDIRVGLLELMPSLMYQLGNWWSERVEEQGDYEHGHHRAAELRPPLFRVYDEALSNFIGSWENTRTDLAQVPEQKNFQWSASGELAKLNIAHLQETARMLLAAVARGDRSAAEWLADVLNKWSDGMRFEHDPYPLYEKSHFLTVDDLKRDWTSISISLGLSEQPAETREEEPIHLQRGVVIAAIRNFWHDVRLLTIELLISWASEDQVDDAGRWLTVDIAAGLLTGRQWKAGRSRSGTLRDWTAPRYLTAKVRQLVAGEPPRGTYVALLDAFVGRIRDMRRPGMITSRVYSLRGADDVESLQEQQLALLILLSSSDWQPTPALQRQIAVWVASSPERLESLRHTIRAWLDRLGQAPELLPALTTILLEWTGKGHTRQEGFQRLNRGLESLRDFIETVRSQQISGEAIDEGHLRELGEFASETAFSHATGDFPLNLLREVRSTAEPMDDFRLVISQVRKGELTRTRLEQRASNERQHWSDTMKQQVAAVVLADILANSTIRSLLATDAESYWETLKREAGIKVKVGEHPILLLDNGASPDWIWEWQHPGFDDGHRRPNDLRVWHAENKGSGYVCNFNEIEVYVAPILPGQSILISREAFRPVSFTEYERGRFVDVTASERADSQLLVDLTFKFSRRIETHAHECVRFYYEGQPIGTSRDVRT
ncbi:hypothetical protein [Paraburkholderia sediminicola]|uniref:hypothetical protein n=1 Tax=Paraburkholderia sediminicola TaxID=458836 RepID=UPI0038B6EB06